MKPKLFTKKIPYQIKQKITQNPENASNNKSLLRKWQFNSISSEQINLAEQSNEKQQMLQNGPILMNKKIQSKTIQLSEISQRKKKLNSYSYKDFIIKNKQNEQYEGQANKQQKKKQKEKNKINTENGYYQQNPPSYLIKQKSYQLKSQSQIITKPIQKNINSTNRRNLSKPIHKKVFLNYEFQNSSSLLRSKICQVVNLLPKQTNNIKRVRKVTPMNRFTFQLENIRLAEKLINVKPTKICDLKEHKKFFIKQKYYKNIRSCSIEFEKLSQNYNLSNQKQDRKIFLFPTINSRRRYNTLNLT